MRNIFIVVLCAMENATVPMSNNKKKICPHCKNPECKKWQFANWACRQKTFARAKGFVSMSREEFEKITGENDED